MQYFLFKYHWTFLYPCTVLFVRQSGTEKRTWNVGSAQNWCALTTVSGQVKQHAAVDRNYHNTDKFYSHFCCKLISCLFFFISNLIHCFSRLRTISAILFALHVSGLTGPSSGGLNCTCSLWYSPPLQMSLSCGRWERTHDKDICRGGEYHRLHVQFRPPDDGPVRPETCRGKRIADIVRRREKQCIKLEIKKNKLYWDARSTKYQ